MEAKSWLRPIDMEEMHGLDLFSGIGGITIALNEWVRPIAYCEQDRYAQGVLLSRMASGDIAKAPIWDDVRTLSKRELPCEVDIVYGGFPCQDISVAGNGVGLEGKRSGLFFEIVRLAEEIKPAFIFLENVPAIRTRGLDRVIQELTQVGYDCRWTMLSAKDVGANHKRERWFLLAKSNGIGRDSGRDNQQGRQVCLDEERDNSAPLSDGEQSQFDAGAVGEVLADSEISGWQQRYSDTGGVGQGTTPPRKRCGSTDSGWWAVEPNVGRVADGVQNRVDRLKCLGNAVVPLQAKTAFKELMGL
jgi:DNA (cytosine-5)-methyltransferase 1